MLLSDFLVSALDKGGACLTTILEGNCRANSTWSDLVPSPLPLHGLFHLPFYLTLKPFGVNPALPRQSKHQGRLHLGKACGNTFIETILIF